MFARPFLGVLGLLLLSTSAAGETPPDFSGESYCSLSVLSNNVLRTVDTSTSFRIAPGNVSSWATTTQLPTEVPRLSRPPWWATEPARLMMALGKPEPGNQSLWGTTGTARPSSRWWYSADSGTWEEDAAGGAAGPGGRVSPKCEVIGGGRYVFQSGGRRAISYDFPTCDADASAAFLLDLDALAWTDTHRAGGGAYAVSSAVYLDADPDWPEDRRGAWQSCCCRHIT